MFAPEEVTEPTADAVAPPGPSGNPPPVEPAQPPSPAATRPLRPGDWQLAAWRSFLRTHAHLVRRLEQDLQSQHKIALASYDVLVQLAEAPDHRLRMSELAQAVLLSRSGLTRLVDSMQREGLVERRPDPCDARGLYTVLTRAGVQALREASVVHLAGISELFVNRLADSELVEIARLMDKLEPPGGQAAAL